MSNERFLMIESNLTNLAFKLVSITKSKYDSDWHSILHSHPFTELFYVVNGEGSFDIEHQSFPVKANDFVLINPLVEHTERSSPENPLEYIVLGVEGISFSHGKNPEEGEVPFLFVNFYDEQREILAYLNTILQEISIQAMSYEKICHNIMEIILIRILRHQHVELETNHASKTTKDIALIKHYLQTNYRNRISLEDLAQLTHLSRYYIAHSFKKDVGMSPMDYLNQIRLEESRALLVTTNYSVGQISSIVGFSSQSYFTEQFKKNYDTTPTDFRKVARAKES